MSEDGLISRAEPLPVPVSGEADAAESQLADIEELSVLAGAERDFLIAVIAGSTFFAGLLRRYPEVANCNPDDFIGTLVTGLEGEARACESEADIKALLRQARSKAALVIGLADLGRIWDVEKVTHHLTLVADACINAAINWLLRDAERRGNLTGLDRDDTGKECGLVALAMGKHGAHELNFSSDVDLIVLFDPECTTVPPEKEAAPLFVRITKRLVSLLQDVTEDGYVYRTDLRLRPDPRATQVAISVDAALNYYESMGQNWERAAMIKARPVAGDLKLGEFFLKELRPFVWRKYLDFAAIAEVHKLKRQIHSVKGHGEIAVLGHNVKLGRGGIREIEFFVQTQQLIAGGRNDRLRGMQTLDMLDRFVSAGWVEKDVATDLDTAYRFLRMIEHRIQMVADQQSHELPASEEVFESFARFAGFSSGDALAGELKKTLKRVQDCYDSLFEDTETESGTADLVFTGSDDDPETIARLAAMGFNRPGDVSQTIKGWYAGRYSALRSPAARERLDGLIPDLLQALSQAGIEPDAAFSSFDRFLSGLPSGVQLFAMLGANRHLLELIANILGTAPRLADELARRPRIFDAVIDPGFFSHLPDAEELLEMAQRTMPDKQPYDVTLDQARVMHREMMFRVGARILSGTLAAGDASRIYSDLADTLIDRLLASAFAEVSERHGTVDDGDMAVIGMGKLGGREMTATSDLDLITVYDHAPDAATSDGAKPLGLGQYFARISQRMISALTVPTAEGGLYEVDMRLRPSGNKGPVATSLSSFIEYQKESAWTWERMALTRARVVAGDPALKEKIEAAIHEALCRPCDAAKVMTDALDMRKILLKEKPPSSLWDLKLVRGGIVELEFIVQTLQLIHASSNPGVLSRSVAGALDALHEAGHLSDPVASELKRACGLYQNLSQILKLGIHGEFSAEKSPAGLIGILNQAAACPDIKTTQALIEQTSESVAVIFDDIVGDPEA